jgi:hypothetical protein
MKNKRVYVFDWDDNIIHMSSTLMMEKFVNGKWELIDITSSEYAKNRNNPEYRHPLSIADPYFNFHDSGRFIEHLGVAINNRGFGPSFPKFKECLIHGNDFAIITARGQSPETIMAGILMLIGNTFLPNELTQMLSNVDNIIHYLHKQTIIPVSYEGMEFPIITESGLEDTIEIRKILALDSYIETKISKTDEFELDGKFSVGISDDDEKNIKTIKDFIEKALKPKYPNIHFVVYDTSNPENIVKRPI